MNLSSTATQAGARHDVRPGAQLRPLEPLVGTWRMEGRQHEGFFGPAADVCAEETFEWLPGGLFLVHRLEGKLGDGDIACIEVWEAGGEGFELHTFYNDGTRHRWRAHEADGVWSIESDREVNGEPWKIRCTMRFEDGGDTRTSRWERSLDGGASWATFWDVVARRAEASPALRH